MAGAEKLNSQRQAPRADEAPLALRPGATARALHIAPRTLWSWTSRGLIPHIRVGRTILYPVAELEKWLAERAAKAVRK